MSETWSETRDANTCLVGSGKVRSGSVRVRLVEFGLMDATNVQIEKSLLCIYDSVICAV